MPNARKSQGIVGLLLAFSCICRDHRQIKYIKCISIQSGTKKVMYLECANKPTAISWHQTIFTDVLRSWEPASIPRTWLFQIQGRADRKSGVACPVFSFLIKHITNKGWIHIYTIFIVSESYLFRGYAGVARFLHQRARRTF